MTVAGQPTTNYFYDDANRLTQITQGLSTVAFTYDGAGRRTSLTLPNGVVVEYTYDSASRLTELKYKNGAVDLGNLTYFYDKAGNRTKVGGSFARTGLPQAVTTATYDNANRQTVFGGKTMAFDLNGNLTSITESGSTTTHTWNARNQLTAMSGPGVSASFVYDGLGRREKKTINGSLTEFLYDGINPVQETSGATVLANILSGRGIDEYFTRTDVPAATTSHFLTDALGSIITLADSTAMVQTEYTYEPFGKTSMTGASDSNSIQYTGRENDGTGLHYNRARYYHPGLQRFIAEDFLNLGQAQLWVQGAETASQGHDLRNFLLLNSQAVNGYSYAVNNALRYGDPSGLWYVDLNATWGFVPVRPGVYLGITGGFLIGPDGLHVYGGPAIAIGPSPVSGSITGSLDDIVRGWSCGVQINTPGGIAIQAGKSRASSKSEDPPWSSRFFEIGIGGPPGVSGSCFYVSGPLF